MNRYAKQVLVPTDFSEESFAALEYAVFYANRTDSGIHLIHVANRRCLKQGGDVRTYRALLQISGSSSCEHSGTGVAEPGSMQTINCLKTRWHRRS